MKALMDCSLHFQLIHALWILPQLLNEIVALLLDQPTPIKELNQLMSQRLRSLRQIPFRAVLTTNYDEFACGCREFFESRLGLRNDQVCFNVCGVQGLPSVCSCMYDCDV